LSSNYLYRDTKKYGHAEIVSRSHWYLSWIKSKTVLRKHTVCRNWRMKRIQTLRFTVKIVAASINKYLRISITEIFTIMCSKSLLWCLISWELLNPKQFKSQLYVTLYGFMQTLILTSLQMRSTKRPKEMNKKSESVM
jgi:hypothetical protein